MLAGAVVLAPTVNVSFEEHRLLQGCGFDTVGSAAAYNNASDFLMYFTQVFCSHVWIGN